MASAIDLPVKKPFAAPPVPPASANGAGHKDTSRHVQLGGHVGFDSLPQQLVHHLMSMGFTFNILCVGETGIGKTTCMESLFNKKLDFEPCNSELPTVQLRSNSFDLEEGGVHLNLSVIETAGFGDQLDKDKSAQVIVEYINSQFESYLQEELKIRRSLSLYKDTRVHVCLYFISPTGHGLKALDVVAMRELSQRVNVIPVIAKADTTSKEELQRFKAKIVDELKSHKIEVYRFPVDDETVAPINTQLNSHVPFAVVGSTDFVKRNGKSVRARSYPWGIVEVENEDHCDFIKLREALLRVNVEDLRDRTNRVHYEKFRRDRLTDMGIKDGDTGPRMAQILQEKRSLFEEDRAKELDKLKTEITRRTQRKEEELQQMEQQVLTRYQASLRSLQNELTQTEAEIQNIEHERQLMEQRINSLASQTNKKKK